MQKIKKTGVLLQQPFIPVGTNPVSYTHLDVYKRQYQDIPGFCRVVSREEIARHKYALVPGRYVGFDRSQVDHMSKDRLHAELSEIKNLLLSAGQSAKQTLNLLEELIDG